MVGDKDSRITFGIDLLPQESPQAKTPPKYALVILEEGSVVKRFGAVSRSRLIRLVCSYHPDVLAVDNVYELASNSDMLKHLVSKLPPGTKMVQVTGPPSEAMTLQTAALRYGLNPPSRLSPLEEAEASARLAELGAGCEIEVMENETKILVCRSVGLGPGGSSQSRYRRGIHTTILTLVKRIEEALRKAGVDYDLFTEKSDFGLERAEFTAYAPRTSLYGVVRPWQGSYVKVIVKPIFKEHVEFVQRKPPRSTPYHEPKPRKKLIIGVDPGTTCGLAVIALDSTPLHVSSRRGLTRGEITRIIMRLGEPAIVASDVTPPPEFVAKLARTLDATLFTTEVSMQAVDKQDIAQAYSQQHGVELKDPHMRDALVASVKAFQHYRNKFEQIVAHAREMEVKVPLDEVKALVVRGYSIQKAFETLMPRPDGEAVEEPPERPVEEEKATPHEVEVRELRQKALLYREQVKRIKDSNRRLKQSVKSLKGEIARLRSALEEVRSEQTQTIRREREYHILQGEVETLRGRLKARTEEAQRYRTRLEMLRHYRGLESKGEVLLLKPVETFTRDGLDKAFQLYNIKRGDAIILIDSSGGGVSTAEELAKRGVKAVIYGTPMAHQAEETLRSYGVSIIPLRGLEVEWIEGYPYTRASDIEEAIGRAEDRERLEAESKLESIVNRYKEERAKALEKR